MTDKGISPLRQRMIEDMEVRGFTAGTQRGYIRAVRDFTAFFGRSPDQADKEDLRRFQHHMRMQGASAGTMNMAVSALRFFFGVILDRGDAEVAMTLVRQPQRLPVILSPEEVGAASRRMHRVSSRERRCRWPMVPGLQGLGGGLPQGRRHRPRAQGDPGASRVRAARTAMPCWRTICWRCCAIGGGLGREKGVMLAPGSGGGWLFPGQNPVNHLTARQLEAHLSTPPRMPPRSIRR